MAVQLNILPERQRKYRFAITPLADAMFQLLIFFMLSSNFTIYTLLPLKTTAEAPDPKTNSLPTMGSDGNISAQTPQSEPDTPAIWIIGANSLLVAGERFDFDSLETLAEALLQSDENAELILFVEPTAQVQDLATVLARLKTAGISQVKLSQDN